MKRENVSGLFGKAQVGYVLIESERLSDWRRFLQNGVGLHLASESDDLLAFRMDGHQRRLIIRLGPAEDVVALGLHLLDTTALDEVKARLCERDIPFNPGNPPDAALRGVRQYWHLNGPKKLGVEFFTEPLTTDEPLWMLPSGFITGDSGMGHVAITSRQPEKMRRFWLELFDARISDAIEEAIAGLTVDITFLRLNERHHSIAIAATRGLRMDPIRTRIQHMNLLVKTMEDLSAAYRRLIDLGFEMAHEIGQHPNDKEVSFYVVTPSGFELELGWNALTVSEATWKPADYYGISLWGHKPRNATLGNFITTNAGNFRRGMKSLLHPEFSPL